MNGERLLTWQVFRARYEKVRISQVHWTTADMAVHVSAFIEGHTRASGFNFGFDCTPVHIRCLALALRFRRAELKSGVEEKIVP